MKHLPKHLRPRWRYLAVGIEAWPDADLDRRGFQNALWSAARALLGDPGSADADLRVIRFSVGEAGGATAIVRVRRGEVEPARAALSCIETIQRTPVGVRVRGVSGTIRGCEQKDLPSTPETATETTVAFAGDEQTAIEHAGGFDVCLDNEFVGTTRLDFE